MTYFTYLLYLPERFLHELGEVPALKRTEPGSPIRESDIPRIRESEGARIRGSEDPRIRNPIRESVELADEILKSRYAYLTYLLTYLLYFTYFTYPSDFCTN